MAVFNFTLNKIHSISTWSLGITALIGWGLIISYKIQGHQDWFLLGASFFLGISLGVGAIGFLMSKLIKSDLDRKVESEIIEEEK